jgi:CheY-like chemotaxis protein
MPTVSGLELVARLRAMDFKGRIIVFSSELSEDVDATYRHHQVDFILPKPVFPSELRALFATL